MKHLSRSFLFVLGIVCLLFMICVSGSALAADAPAAAPASVTGLPILDTILTYMGAVGTALATLASFLPRTWKFTQVLARLSTDVRGILTPDIEDDPSWARRVRGDSSSKP